MDSTVAEDKHHIIKVNGATNEEPLESLKNGKHETQVEMKDGLEKYVSLPC